MEFFSGNEKAWAYSIYTKAGLTKAPPLQDIIKEADDSTTLILAGDFNCRPYSGVFQSFRIKNQGPRKPEREKTKVLAKGHAEWSKVQHELSKEDEAQRVLERQHEQSD